MENFKCRKVGGLPVVETVKVVMFSTVDKIPGVSRQRPNNKELREQIFPKGINFFSWSLKLLLVLSNRKNRGTQRDK